MKLNKIRIASFRGINHQMTFTIGNNITVIRGENGTCKTSIIDAFLWAVTGKVDRFHGSRDLMVYKDAYKNNFSSNPPIVELEFSKNDDFYHLIQIGKNTGEIERTILRKNNKNLPRGKVKRTLEKIFPYEYWRNFVILEQENLSEFITDSNPRSRYKIFTEFLGLKDYITLREIIQKTSKYLSEEEIIELKRKIIAKETRKEFPEEFDKNLFVSLIERTIGSKIDPIIEEIREGVNYNWSLKVFELDKKLSEYFSLPESVSIDELDRSTKDFSKKFNDLDKEKRRLSRDLRENQRLIERIENENNKYLQISVIEETIKNITNKKSQYKGDSKLLEEVIIKLKTNRTELLNEASRFKTKKQSDLHQLMMLGSVLIEDSAICPLCNSHLEYNLKERLDSILSKLEKEQFYLEEERERLEIELGGQEDTLQRLSEKVRNIEREISRFNLEKISILDELNNIRQSAENLDKSLKKNQPLSEILIHLQKNKEDLEMDIANIENNVEELEIKRTFVSILKDSLKQVTDKIRITDEKHKFLARQLRTNIKLYQSLDNIITRLRNEEETLVKSFISQFADEFQLIYNKLNPHPFFKQVKILPNYNTQRGELFLESENINVKNVFSTTQSNILALSIFLAVNLFINKLEKIPLILDDPVQSMDSQNMVKVVELLTILSKRQQLIVTTASEKFSSLLKEYFKYWTKKSTLMEINLYEWSQKGPIVKEEKIQSLKEIDSIERILSAMI